MKSDDYWLPDNVWHVDPTPYVGAHSIVYSEVPSIVYSEVLDVWRYLGYYSTHV